MTKHILTTILLMLSLSAYVAAQPRRDGRDLQWGQNLVGLGEIGVIVKYSQADELPEARRPAISKMLRDRSRELLRKGEVRLLESTDEARLVGKPRLVVTLTLKKQPDVPPAVRMEIDLYRRVRLSRDTSKELELPIWSGSLIAPDATEPRLFSLLEGILNNFVKDYQALNVNPSQAATALADLPPPVKDDANPLEGLNGIVFWLSFAFNRVQGVPTIELPSPITDPEFQRTLKSEAQRKLKRAGIKLLERDNDQTGRPHLTLSLTLNLASVDNYSPAISVVGIFRQSVRLVNNPLTETFMPTWKSHTSAGWPITEEAVRRLMNSQMDQFIEAYKAANQKSSASN